MLSFVWLFSFLPIKKYCCPRAEERIFPRTCRLRGQGQADPSWRTPPLIHRVEQESEQEVFVELDDFDDCIEEKEDADYSTG